MALNPYFSNLGENADNTNEQDLVNGFVRECIQIMGINTQYIRRNETNLDVLYGEDNRPTFDAATLIEMYIENIENWDGQDEMLTEYGIAFQDQVTFRVSTVAFTEVVGGEPEEGDLVYMPLSNNLFSVLKVTTENQFYPNGTLPSYTLLCEEYVYSQEDITTGIAEIDDVMNNELDDVTTPANVGDNEQIQTDADTVIEFDETNPFGSF